MITVIEALAAGNALRIWLSPPPGAKTVRVLRRPNAGFTGPDDPMATVAYEGSDGGFLDTAGLVNGVAYHYREYWRLGGNWIEGETQSATPATRYRGDACDPQTILRERIELGMKAEVLAGRLKPANGKIPVLTAPFALATGVTFPCVSVHLESDTPAERALGETLISDEHLEGLGWDETEGWLSRVALNVVGVSLNSDERIALRRALKRIMLANLPIFEAAGMQLVEFAQHDIDREPTEHNAPLFFAAGSFSCLAPSFVTARVGEIEDVTVDASFTTPKDTPEHG